MKISKTRELTEILVKKKSITPQDKGCQYLIAARLSKLGFKGCIETHGPDVHKVTNLWTIKKGKEKNGVTLVFAGHTDVVSPGVLKQWNSDPFTPLEKDGKLYGRGIADMKTSIAAFVIATEEFILECPNHRGSIAFLLTSDEEGPAKDGTIVTCNMLKKNNIHIDYCIVGEPTSSYCLGDTIKNGRRGSLSGKMKILGKQGHIAYPDLIQNPIHSCIPILNSFNNVLWDDGNSDFTPTIFQISNIHAGVGLTNVTPAELEIDFNLRFGTANTIEKLKKKIEGIILSHNVPYHLKWTHEGEPFLTKPAELSKTMQDAIYDIVGIQSKISTTGGTSDGRFIAKICPQIIEFGPCNNTIHQVNENINIEDIDKLKEIYKFVLMKLLN